MCCGAQFAAPECLAGQSVDLVAAGITAASHLKPLQTAL